MNNSVYFLTYKGQYLGLPGYGKIGINPKRLSHHSKVVNKPRDRIQIEKNEKYIKVEPVKNLYDKQEGIETRGAMPRNNGYLNSGSKSLIFAFIDRSHVSSVSNQIKYLNIANMIDNISPGIYAIYDKPYGVDLLKPICKSDINISVMDMDNADIMARLNGTNICLVDKVRKTPECLLLRGSILNENINVDMDLTLEHIVNTYFGISTDYKQVYNNGNININDLMLSFSDMLDNEEDMENDTDDHED